MNAKPQSRAWRWPIYGVALLGFGVSTLWAMGTLLVTNTMGWGGRSFFQIAATIILLVLVPLIASMILGFRSVEAVKAGRLSIGLTYAISSVLLAPLAWVLGNAGLFAG